MIDMRPLTKILLVALLSVLGVACQAETSSERSPKAEPVLPISGPSANTETVAALRSDRNPFDDDIENIGDDIDKVTPSFDADNPGQIYIPKDLDDCFVELDRMLHPKFIEKFKAGGEAALIDQHFGLGLLD